MRLGRRQLGVLISVGHAVMWEARQGTPGNGKPWVHGRLKRHLPEVEWKDPHTGRWTALTRRTAYVVAEDLERKGLVRIRESPHFDVVVTEAGMKALEEWGE